MSVPTRLRQEWRLLSRERTLAVLAVVLAALVALGVRNGSRTVSALRSAQEGAAAEELRARDVLRTRISAVAGGADRQPDDVRDPLRVANVLLTPRAHLPLLPLSVLSLGEVDLRSLAYTVTLRSPLDEGDAATVNPTHQLIGTLDWAFVVVFLWPLLLLVLGHGLLAGERESGTLALVMSQPVRLARWAAVRVALRAAVGWALLAVPSATGLMLAGGGGEPARLLLLVLLVAGYGAFWLAAALAVDARGGSRDGQALTLAGLWLALVLLVPWAVNALVASIAPVPSRIELVRSLRYVTAEASRQGSELLARYYEDHPEFAPAQGEATLDFASLSVAVEEEADRRMAPVLATFAARRDEQQEWVQRLRWLSPSLVAQAALDELAGTDSRRFDDFHRQVDAFHAMWRAHFRPFIQRRALLGVEDVDRLPVFRHREEAGNAVPGSVAAAATVLWGMAAGLVLWSSRRLRGYAVA